MDFISKLTLVWLLLVGLGEALKRALYEFTKEIHSSIVLNNFKEMVHRLVQATETDEGLIFHLMLQSTQHSTFNHTWSLKNRFIHLVGWKTFDSIYSNKNIEVIQMYVLT